MEERPALFAYAAGGLLPVIVAAAAVGLRSQLDSANHALLLVLVVVLVAALGGRGPAALSAVVAAISFDFFFTRPYYSLRIASADDITTTLILLGIAGAVGQLAVRSRQRRVAVERKRQELRSLERVAERIGAGASTDEVAGAVCSELSALLSLRACRLRRGEEPPSLPVLDRAGRVSTSVHVFAGDEFALPAGGVVLPVVSRGRSLAYLLLDPEPSVGISIDDRLVAVALADQLAAVLAAG